MILDHINKIRGNISIHATKKTDNILDGSYRSVYKGRSLNFEDLREYVPGDNIRDIDWKASSRTSTLLVKRFIAEKKHNIMLVGDVGLSYRAHSQDLDDKSEVALLAAGTLGYIAAKNGDNVGAVFNDGELLKYFPVKQGFYNLERILTDYESCIIKRTPYTIERTLDYILRNISRRLVLLIVTDASGMEHMSDRMLKQLASRHDILVVQVSDADFTGGSPFEVTDEHYVPPFIAGNKKLRKMEQTLKNSTIEENERRLLRLGIVNVLVRSKEDVNGKLIELMERHKYANIR